MRIWLDSPQYLVPLSILFSNVQYILVTAVFVAVS